MSVDYDEIIDFKIDDIRQLEEKLKFIISPAKVLELKQEILIQKTLVNLMYREIRPYNEPIYMVEQDPIITRLYLLEMENKEMRRAIRNMCTEYKITRNKFEDIVSSPKEKAKDRAADKELELTIK